MESRTLTSIAIIGLFAALAIPVGLAAQENASKQSAGHHHYKLIDLETLHRELRLQPCGRRRSG